MIVWRVESLNGMGPYRKNSGLSIDARAQLLDTDNHQHPNPEDDIPDWSPETHKGWLFGFHSLMRLKLWFSYMKNHADELVVVTYETEKWLEGDSQLVFQPLKKLTRKSLKEIYEMQ